MMQTAKQQQIVWYSAGDKQSSVLEKKFDSKSKAVLMVELARDYTWQC